MIRLVRGNATCHLLIYEEVGIEILNIKGFKYFFSLIFEEKIRQNKYLGGIWQVVEKIILTNGMEYVNLSIRFV